MGETLRAMVQESFMGQKIGFSAHDLELGYSYATGALVPNGTSRPLPDPLGQVVHPTTRPGHRLPHAWLRVKDDTGKAPKSTHDLVGFNGDLLLITDFAGADWVTSAAQAHEVASGLKIIVATIDTQPVHGKDVQYIDHNDKWKAVRQLEQGGAILIRPDNMVGWRSIRASKNRGAELLEAIAEMSGKGELYKKTQSDSIDQISTAASTNLAPDKGAINL